MVNNYQGSVIGYTDASGSFLERYKYGPYGEPKNDVNAEYWGGSRFRYTGQIAIPEVKLYHYKARAYDLVLGTFLQTDPTGMCNDSRITNSDGACASTGGFTTGNDGAAQGMMRVQAIRRVAQSVSKINWAAIGEGSVGLSKSISIAGIVAWSLTPTQTASPEMDEAPKYIVVYRLYGGASGPYGHSRTTQDSRTMKNPRDELGLPDGNTATRINIGRLMNFSGVKYRPAMPLDGNKGGAPEYLIPNPKKQIVIMHNSIFEEPSK